jgi:lipopolysaccharide transport system permease protein
MTRSPSYTSDRRWASPFLWPVALVVVGLLAWLEWQWLSPRLLPFGFGVWGSLPLPLKTVVTLDQLALLLGAVVLGVSLLRRAVALHTPDSSLRSAQVLARWYRYANPASLVYDLYLNRHLLRQLTRRDIESRYRGSYLGMVWSLVTPLLMLAIYTFVFSVIFQARWRPDAPVDRIEFAITLFAGLIAFNMFAECANRAPSLIVSSPNYVKRAVFPLEILPVSVLGSALFQAAVSLCVLVAGLLLMRHAVPMTLVLVPLVMIPLAALSLAVAWFLAALGVYLRDTANAVGIVTQMLFFVTPLFYPVEAVPARFRPLLWLNPLTPIVDGFRRVVVWGQPLDMTAWVAVTLMSLVALVLGYTWFMKTKVGFANVV